jgi:hypothetical protein
MTSPRKTLKLQDLIVHINGILENSTDDMQQARHAVASVLETQLMNANVYKGFKYIGEGNEAGQIDDSRRAYYLHWILL